jgi:hypothetical protein
MISFQRSLGEERMRAREAEAAREAKIKEAEAKVEEAKAELKAANANKAM